MTDGGGARPTEEELERIRAERDELRVKLERTEDRARRGGRLRRTVVALLVVLATVCLALGGPGIWAARNALDTDQYLEIVEPLGRDPAVARALADRLTTELFAALDTEQVIADALPERAAFLAAPLSDAIRGFVRDEVVTLLQSETFARLWVETNRFAHAQLVAVLRGEEGAVLTTAEGEVVLNLLPVINAALARIQGTASDLVGADVTLPQLESGALPDEMRTRIESALGVDLPENFGEIVVFSDDSLEAVQAVVVRAERSLWLIVIVFVLSVAGALALSRRRRRTLIQLTSALLVVVVAERRIARIVEADVAEGIQQPGARAAVRVTAAALLDDFLDASLWIGLVLLVVLLVALLSGPYPWAVAARRGAGRLARLVGDAVTGIRARTGDEATAAWIREHLTLLQFGGLAIGLLLLVVLPVGWIGLLVLIAAIVAYELLLQRIARPGPEPDAGDDRANEPA